MEINGLPLHVLVVHGAVVFVPLAALGAIALALPRWRWLVRWPALVVNVTAAVLVQVAVVSGQDLQRDRRLDTPLVDVHVEWAERLRVAVFALAVLVAFAFWALGHVTRLMGARDRQAKLAALEKPFAVVLPLVAVAVLVLVFLTGEAGARAVWAPEIVVSTARRLRGWPGAA